MKKNTVSYKESISVRPAVEKLINEADAIAKTYSVDYTDHTYEIFGVAEESED